LQSPDAGQGSNPPELPLLDAARLEEALLESVLLDAVVLELTAVDPSEPWLVEATELELADPALPLEPRLLE
jgi:hypothetical protein